jgi:hypothetical protein
MPRPLTALATVIALSGLAYACSETPETAPPIATPSVTLGSQVAAIGSPLEMSYRFSVVGTPPASGDYFVFVHFLDADGELMWTDDHRPPTPVNRWTPGATIEYQRTTFVPKLPFVGQATVEVGLYAPATGERLALTGDPAMQRQRSYRVAGFEMALQSDTHFVVFKDGWHAAEVAPTGSGIEWQWSRKDATLSFTNPRRSIRVFLSVDQPANAFPEAQRVEVRIGDAVVDSFTLAAGQNDLRRFEVQADQLGAGDVVEMTLSVDKTFVPASVPALGSADSRELGIRVFRAFVQPL